jgi:hypothetical protein
MEGVSRRLLSAFPRRVCRAACVRDALQVIHYDGDVGEHPPELVMPKKSSAAR